MPKASILFISTQLPYPPKSGGTIKSWHYLSHLTDTYAVGLACFLKEEDPLHLEGLNAQLELRETISLPLSVPRNVLTLIKSYLFSNSLNLYRNRSSTFKSLIEEKADQYDILLVDHYEMFQYVPSDYKGKVIIHTHNAEFELWRRMAGLSKNPLLKLALRLESKRVKNYEAKIFKLADLVYASPSDIQSFQMSGMETDNFKITYHLGNDELLKLPPMQFEHTEKSLLFMGTLSWEPNIDGLLWFIEEVFPLLQKQHQDLKLYVLGKQTDERLAEAAKTFSGIELCGFIDHIESYLDKSRVFVVPLRFGSGMKVKVLEGMYRGLPIVTTEIGAEGLEVNSGNELLISKGPAEFADACLQLLEDKALWEAMRDSSRALASKKYTWELLFEKMDAELERL